MAHTDLYPTTSREYGPIGCAHGEDYDMASIPDTERLMRFLPSNDDLRSGLVGRLHRMELGIEIAEVGAQRYVFLRGDDRPYMRKKVYGRFEIDTWAVEELLAADDLTPPQRAGLDKQVGELLDGLATLIAEDVRAFRVERGLDVVVIRALRNAFGCWLQRRGDNQHFRIAMLTDQLWAPIGAYYHITPVGELEPQESQVTG
jgi:hypothetical protein